MVDGGRVVDSGSARDSGPVVVDSGPVVVDSGPVAVDSGPVVADSGPVVADSGPVVADSGPVVVDSGPVVADSGPVVVDSGPECRVCSCGPPVSYEISGDDCVQRTRSGTELCVPLNDGCPGCVTLNTVHQPPTVCDELAPGTCTAEVAPVWQNVPDGDSCGEGCQCHGGERTEVDCTTGSGDEDGDGAADCLDPDCAEETCAASSSCRVSPGEDVFRCYPRRESSCELWTPDEDADGLTNCADSADCDNTVCGFGCLCLGGAATGEDCTLSGIDEESDGAFDCQDPECEGLNCGDGCICADGVAREYECSPASGDEDGDGAANCADFDCNGAVCGNGCRCHQGAAMELNCGYNTGDEDGDGLANCADDDCLDRDCAFNGGATAKCGGDGQCHELACTCNQLADNDGDGQNECVDADCGPRAGVCLGTCSD